MLDVAISVSKTSNYERTRGEMVICFTGVHCNNRIYIDIHDHDLCTITCRGCVVHELLTSRMSRGGY